MEELVRKEEVAYCDQIPARILLQELKGTECFVKMHWHDEIEIDLILKGDALFYVNGRDVRLRPGEFILINSGDVHLGNGCPDAPLVERQMELITVRKPTVTLETLPMRPIIFSKVVIV